MKITLKKLFTNKKIKIFLGILISLLAILLIAKIKLYSISQYTSDIYLKNDGSAKVTNQVQMRFVGSYNQISIPQTLPNGVDTYKNLKVEEIVDGKVKRLKRGSDEDLAKEPRTNYGKYVVSPNWNKDKTTIALRIYDNFSNKKVTYRISYNVSDAVVNYGNGNVSLFNWNVVDGFNKKVKNINLNVKLQEKKVKKLKSWIHGSLKYDMASDSKKGILNIKVRKSVPNKSIRLVLLTTKDAFLYNSNTIYTTPVPSLKSVSKHEFETSDVQLRNKKIKELSYKAAWLVTILVGIGSFLNALRLYDAQISIFKFFKFKRYNYQKPRVNVRTFQLQINHSKINRFTYLAQLLEAIEKKKVLLEIAKNERLQDTDDYKLTVMDQEFVAENRLNKLIFGNLDEHNSIKLSDINESLSLMGENNLNKIYQKWRKDEQKFYKKMHKKHTNIFSFPKKEVLISAGIAFLLLIVNIILSIGKTYLGLPVSILIMMSLLSVYVMGMQLKFTPDDFEKFVDSKAFARAIEGVDKIRVQRFGNINKWKKLIPYIYTLGSSQRLKNKLFAEYNLDTEKGGLPVAIHYMNFANELADNFVALDIQNYSKNAKKANK